jgi:hypothetical protein
MQTNNEVDDNFEVTPDMMIWKAMYLPDCMVRAVWELGFENPTAIQVYSNSMFNYERHYIKHLF